jgi:hypothetical protein
MQSGPCRSRGRQRDGERITGEHHERNQPPDGAFAVGAGADQLGHVADGGGLGLDDQGQSGGAPYA